ncbi:shufflon protein C' [Shigella sonnei]|nr:shufflon protein C' [Shigella sonnei]
MKHSPGNPGRFSSIYYKPIQCPAGYVMTGTRMYGIGDGVDEEHVDAYCCPFG